MSTLDTGSRFTDSSAMSLMRERPSLLDRIPTGNVSECVDTRDRIELIPMYL